MAELENKSWVPAGLINPTMDGVVELWGTITDERKRQAVMVQPRISPASKPCEITWSGSIPLVRWFTNQRPNQRAHPDCTPSEKQICVTARRIALGHAKTILA
jgi:hypothetical protein